MAFNGEIFEILSWLPAKVLHKFAVTAKPCRELLSELYFMKTQCYKSLWKPETFFFVHEDSCLRYKAQNLRLISSSSQDCSIGIPTKSLEFLHNKVRVLASGNGLLVCRSIQNPGELILCNPATKTWLGIPLPTIGQRCQYRNMDVNAALLCNAHGKEFPYDYTVMLFALDDDACHDWSLGFNVYVLEEGDWVLKKSHLNTGGRDLNFDYHPVHCKDGGLYFISNCGQHFAPGYPYYWPYVFRYDIVNHQESAIVSLPNEARDIFTSGNMGIFGWQQRKNTCCFESICLVMSIGSRILVWILNDVENSSWQKLLHFDIDRELGVKDSISWNVMNFTVLGNNLIFATDNRIYSYCMVGSEQGKLHEIGDNVCGRSNYVRFNSYSNTLRPCSIGLNSSPRFIC